MCEEASTLVRNLALGWHVGGSALPGCGVSRGACSGSGIRAADKNEAGNKRWPLTQPIRTRGSAIAWSSGIWPSAESRTSACSMRSGRCRGTNSCRKGTQRQAYDDESIPIGEGQTITPPYDVAFMTEVLDPKPTDVVYEVGTGSGYQSAILSRLVKEVYSVEIHKPLSERATEVHKEVGYKNIHTRVGDGYEGWPEAAPFDAIIVTCAPRGDSAAAGRPAQGRRANGDSPGRPVYPERVARYQEGRQADQDGAQADAVRADDRQGPERGRRQAGR